MKTNIILLALSLCCLSVMALNDSLPKRYNFNIGVNWGTGFSGTDDNECHINYNFGVLTGFKQRHYIFLNTNRIERMSIDITSAHEQYKVIGLYSYNLLYGYRLYKNRKFSLIYSMGISYGKGIYRDKLVKIIYPNMYIYTVFDKIEYLYNTDYYDYIGIPISLKLFGLYTNNGFFVDLNLNIHKHFDYGFTVNYFFGRFTKSK
ncbi:MAG: hypothetical protein Q8880_05945 [Bacteroidota bacterium]|nr:hypothetical protein [Bacteroidota bacterium]